MEIVGALPEGTVGLSSPGDPGYFRLNIWGMSAFCGYMDIVGMLDWGSPEPRFPDYGDGPWPEESTPSYEERQEASRLVTDWSAAEPVGIPRWKFGSNDGWLVTPAEIRSALALMESSGASEELAKVLAAGDDADYWRAWIAYLQRAEKAEGFRVW